MSAERTPTGIAAALLGLDEASLRRLLAYGVLMERWLVGPDLNERRTR
jgi:hypothetical protein